MEAGSYKAYFNIIPQEKGITNSLQKRTLKVQKFVPEVPKPKHSYFGLINLQGWEFAHQFSERIPCFLPKNEQMRDSLKKMSDLLIRSFLVSELSNLLMIARFL